MLSLAMHGCLLVVDHTAFTDCKMTMKWKEDRQYSSLFTHMVTLTKINNTVSADLGCSGIPGFLDTPQLCADKQQYIPPFFTKQTTTHQLPCCILIGMQHQVHITGLRSREFLFFSFCVKSWVGQVQATTSQIDIALVHST